MIHMIIRNLDLLFDALHQERESESEGKGEYLKRFLCALKGMVVLAFLQILRM